MTIETELAVKVKTLDWSKTSYGTPEVYSVVGVYRINHAGNGGWSVSVKGGSLRDSDGRTNFATIDNAKAAAQQDYSARILSALTLKDDPGNGGDGEAEPCEQLRQIGVVQRMQDQKNGPIIWILDGDGFPPDGTKIYVRSGGSDGK